MAKDKDGEPVPTSKWTAVFFTDSFVGCFKTSGVQFAVLSVAGSVHIGRRLRDECGIPVILCWDDMSEVTLTGLHLTIVVSVFLFSSYPFACFTPKLGVKLPCMVEWLCSFDLTMCHRSPAPL